jgi:hypothetical protein
VRHRATGAEGSDGATGDGAAASSAASPRPRLTAGASLGPDGVVPWAAEPAVDADFTTPPPTPPPVTRPTCRVTRLTGAVKRWTSKGASAGEETHDLTMAASLYRYAVLTNTY